MRFFINLLLAYQLEGYDSKRFFLLLVRHPGFFVERHTRQTLDWTMKARLIALLSVFIELGLFVAIAESAFDTV